MNNQDDNNVNNCDRVEDILDELLRSVLNRSNLEDTPPQNRRPQKNHSIHEDNKDADNSATIKPTKSCNSVHLSKIYFKHYKALSKLELHLRSVNILTGANNAGKSTVLGALQVLAAGLRVARRLKPKNLDTPDGIRPAYSIPTEQLTVSLENVFTNYVENQTTVRFEFKNSNSLTIFFPIEGGCILYVSEFSGKYPSTPTDFRKAFPVGIVCVPVLGPLEHDEPLLKETTVNNAIETHRAARHFRNYWHYNPENFDRFANYIAETWPGAEIEPPERRLSIPSTTLHMFCRENRITRELYWMGFGFQVWCQLLTHVSRAGPDDILVVDEPETYLHPLVQRRLLAILRSTGAQVILATHSAPIVMDADMYEVIQISNSMRVARPEANLSNALAFQLGLRPLK